ncbi:hypothetical protein IQ251_05965 [Saccharopolyspora sp. HNM0983]|uniref:Uncharacterized protein n=1 Tax=Saccharopolyspora montiporae TaxID=2781240 RepID=A0A929FZ39_9PSEU|nr:hypothetical protein [Saccharopolyspora sp. HNM0983]
MSALDELFEALRVADEHLRRAQQHLGTGRTALTEVEQALRRIDPEHPESVVPPTLHRADDQVEHAQGLVERTSDTVRDYLTRL